MRRIRSEFGVALLALACGSVAAGCSAESVELEQVGSAAQSLESRWLDPHFRTYGEFSDESSTLRYREGAPGHVPHTDIITVGKLDGNSVGPFAGLAGGSEGTLGVRWAFLREASPDAVKYGFVSRLSGLGELRDQLLESMMPDVLNWEARVGRAVYRQFIDTITGQSSPYYYMKDALQAQFDAEKGLIDGWLRDRIGELENEHMTSCSRGPCLPHYTAESAAARLNAFVPNVNVEVANEPNMYPAMPPRLYAWYYLKYRQHVRSVLSAINQERRNVGRRDAQVRLMPGGLWMMDGFPSLVRSFIDQGVSARAAGVTVSTRVYSDAKGYLSEFLRFLRQPLYLTTSGISGRLYVPGKTFTNVLTYNVEALGNLDVTGWSFYNSNGEFVTTNLTANHGNIPYVRIPRTWTVLPVSSLIDIGNLHFYPYLGPSSAQNLDTQLNGLRDLANLYAANTSTGKVWLTELGNINSGSDDYVINQIMNPTIDFLKRDVRSVRRWYWFKSRGEDVKFEQLSGLPEDGTGAWQVAWWMVGAPVSYLVSLLPGFDVSVPMTPGVATAMDDILYTWRDSPPRQGLMDPGDGGAMRPLGRAYMAAARADGDEYADYVEYTEYQ